MSYRKRILACLLVSVVAAASVAIAIEKVQPTSVLVNQPDVSSSTNPRTLSLNQTPVDKARNLSLQPEAFKLSKKLGRRFADSQRSISTLTGSLTVGPNLQLFKLTRRQNKRGERVEIETAMEPSLLTWEEAEGPKSTARALNETQRALVERLTFDSADQFVLAQLRGASYYTLARSVRPAEAGDSDAYNGPLWTIVRIDDPDRDDRRKPESKSRLYFINESTGLIDKIVSELQGDRIEASFSGWASHEGETIPTQITWTQNGQAILQLKVNNFARLSQ